MTVDDVVGDVEQCANEQLVCGNSLLLDFVARTATGQSPRYESTLGTDGHDQCVLDVLGLHQSEHFCAEVFAPVRPADPAARHEPFAQVHALDAGTVHEDLELRAR